MEIILRKLPRAPDVDRILEYLKETYLFERAKLAFSSYSDVLTFQFIGIRGKFASLGLIKWKGSDIQVEIFTSSPIPNNITFQGGFQQEHYIKMFGKKCTITANLYKKKIHIRYDGWCIKSRKYPMIIFEDEDLRITGFYGWSREPIICYQVEGYESKKFANYPNNPENWKSHRVVSKDRIYIFHLSEFNVLEIDRQTGDIITLVFEDPVLDLFVFSDKLLVKIEEGIFLGHRGVIRKRMHHLKQEIWLEEVAMVISQDVLERLQGKSPFDAIGSHNFENIVANGSVIQRLLGDVVLEFRWASLKLDYMPILLASDKQKIKCLLALTNQFSGQIIPKEIIDYILAMLII